MVPVGGGDLRKQNVRWRLACKWLWRSAPAREGVQLEKLSTADPVGVLELGWLLRVVPKRGMGAGL